MSRSVRLIERDLSRQWEINHKNPSKEGRNRADEIYEELQSADLDDEINRLRGLLREALEYIQTDEGYGDLEDRITKELDG